MVLPLLPILVLCHMTNGRNLTTDQIIEAWNSSSVMSMMPENGWGYKEA